jgi:hypothetical protein
MKWLLLLVGLALMVVAGAGLLASIDLLTTEIGAIYATCSAIAAAAGLIVLALAGVTHRIDALRAVLLRAEESPRRALAEADLAPPIPSPIPLESAEESAEPPPIPTPDSDLGAEAEAAPPLAAEAAPIEPPSAAPTTLVGRYSSGGDNYSIFSDGSIEAETDQGAFRFASMSEFKAYIASKRANA